MKNGAKVRLVQPVIEGSVVERRINPATDELELRVEWKEGDGDTVSRWFDASALVELPATEEGAKA